MTMPRFLFAMTFAFWLVMMSLLVREEAFEQESGGRRVPPEFVLRLIVDQGETSDLTVLWNGEPIGTMVVCPLVNQRKDESVYGFRIGLNNLLFVVGSERMRINFQANLLLDRESLELRKVEGWGRIPKQEARVTFEIDFEQQTYTAELGDENNDSQMAGEFQNLGRDLAESFGGRPEVAAWLQQSLANAKERSGSVKIEAYMVRLAVREETMDAYRVVLEAEEYRADLFVNLVGQVLLIRTPFGLELQTEEKIQPPPL